MQSPVLVIFIMIKVYLRALWQSIRCLKTSSVWRTNSQLVSVLEQAKQIRHLIIIRGTNK